MTQSLTRVVLDTGRGTIVYYKTPHIPDARTVVLMHGLSANHTTWLRAMDELNRLGYNAVAPDIRGHGESDKTIERSRYTMAVMSGDLGMILENEGLDSCIFIGYSYGGSIAIEYAVEHAGAIEGLLLISSNHVTPLHYRWFGFISYLLSYLVSGLGYLCIPFGPRSFSVYDPNQAGGYWWSVWLGLKTMPLSVNAWLVSTGLAMDMRARISRITAPVLIVRASSDPFFTDTEALVMADHLENANVVTLESGHFIATEEAEVSLKLIRGFLTTL